MASPMQGIRNLTGGQLAALVQRVGGPRSVLGIFRGEVEITCTWINRILKCDQPFDPVSFIDNGFPFWRGPIDGEGIEGEIDQDDRSLAIKEVDWVKATFPDYLKEGEEEITGYEHLKRQKEAGDVRFGGNVFLSLWRDYEANEEDSVLEWLFRTHHIMYLCFFGLILRDPDRKPCVLCVSRDQGRWEWSYVRLYCTV